MSINSKLFTLRNSPVKMCLEGFTYADVLTAMKLITLHGGMVATERDSGTIVLASPSDFSSPNYAKFSINWIHDCIAANFFLDVMKYILPQRRGDNVLSSKQTPTMHVHERSLLKRNVQDAKMVVQENSNVEAESSADPSAALLKSTNEVKFFQRSENAGISQGTVQAFCTDLSGSSFDLGAGRAEKMNKTSEFKSQKNGDRYMYSANEEKQIVQYLVEKNAISTASEIGIWQKMKAEKLFEVPYRSARSLKGHFQCYMKECYKDYSNDPKVLREFQNYFEELSAKKLKYVRYSDEENRSIIQFLLDNKAISAGSRKSIWKKMEDDKIFVEPYRSASALKTHFDKYLRRNYVKYLKDPEALKKFPALVRLQR